MESILTPEERPYSRRDNPVTFKRSGSVRGAVLSLLIVLLLIAATILVIKKKPELLGLSKAPTDTQKEAENLVSKVGRIIELPKGEIPQVYTVTDLNQAQDKEFFRNAKEGDKVLVYTDAKKAYIYRPSDNKIIEVGVVNVNNQPQKEVAGDKTEIPIITPTPLPVRSTETPTPSPKPSTQPSKAFTPAPSLPPAQ